MSKAKLKPCPFRHDHRRTYEEVVQYPIGRYYVRCALCLAHGPANETYDGAIAAWNRRATAKKEKP